jgi:hypothetical protein
VEVSGQLHAAAELPPEQTTYGTLCHYNHYTLSDADKNVAKHAREIVIFPEASLEPYWNQNCKM